MRVINKSPVTRHLVVEPWGGEYQIPPGDCLDLVAEGDRHHIVEVELSNDRLVVSSLGHVGAKITVFKGDEQIMAM